MYAADINQYWLDSIKHGASCQSFYPTWILSAYAIASELAAAGFAEAVDIGSGDGRIAYCSRLAGMGAYGLEIDGGLVRLQEAVSGATGVDFWALQADATAFDYLSLGLRRPAFLVSGLPEMGGEMLAEGVINAVLSDPLGGEAAFVLMGMSVMDGGGFGWDETIARFGLRVERMIRLPTHWTAD